MDPDASTSATTTDHDAAIAWMTLQTCSRRGIHVALDTVARAAVATERTADEYNRSSSDAASPFNELTAAVQHQLVARWAATAYGRKQIPDDA